MSNAGFVFDPEFYRESYLSPDSHDYQDPLEDYLASGKAHGNYSCASEYIAKNLPSLYGEYLDLIVGAFDWRAYRSRNRDIRTLSPLDTTYHFVQHGITEWRHFNQTSKLLDRRFAILNEGEDACHLRHPFQAIVHCYHYDILCRLFPYLRNIARLGGRVCVLNSNSEILGSVMSDFLSSLNTGAVRHKAYDVPNYGEDWSSFHWAYEQGLFDEDGVTFKLQTKKSANLGIDGGLAWIDEALQPICGSYQAISRTLRSAAKHKDFGMASRWVLRCGFGANPELINEYIRRLDIVIPKTTNLFWRVEDGISIKSGKTGHPMTCSNPSERLRCQTDSVAKPAVLADGLIRQDLLRLDRNHDSEPGGYTTLEYAPLSGQEVVDYSWPFAAGSMFAATNKTIRAFYEKLGNIDYAEQQAGGNEFCGRFIGHALERVFFYYIQSNNWRLDFH